MPPKRKPKMTTATERIKQRQESIPINIEGLIRDLGLELIKAADLPLGVSGRITLLPSGRYEISANRSEHYYRRRFTMAHELGHYVLHRDLIGRGIDDNTMYRSSPETPFYNTAIQ